MPKQIISHPAENRQLSLFEPQFSQRIRRVIYNGVEYFSLVDIMAEFSDLSSEGKMLWSRTKKRLVADGFELYQAVIQLKLKAKDGKMYKTECADRLTCLRIVQSIPSEKAEPIKRWLAGLADERIEENNNIGLASSNSRARDLALLKAQGYSETEGIKWLETRVDGIDSYKQLMATVKQVVDKPRYGDIVNAEYFALFGEITSALQVILNTKSVRDALPRLQLSALLYGETALQGLIRQQDRMTMEQVLGAVDKIIVPLGEHLKMVSDALGLHHVTGQALLK